MFKDLIINVISFIGVLSGNVVFGTIGALILVIVIVNTLIVLTESKKPSIKELTEDKGE